MLKTFFFKKLKNLNKIKFFSSQVPQELLDKIKKINIPKTDFNERLNIEEKEKSMIKKLTLDFYRDQKNNPKLNKLWVTHDGPPFPTGKPHLGTIMNKVIKDVINRLKVMQGYKVDYKIGFDCYGVTIEDAVIAGHKRKPLKDVKDLYEHYVNENNNPSEHKRIDLESEKVVELRKDCRKYAEKGVKESLEYFIRAGIMFDYNNVYTTMNKAYEYKELEAFKKLYENGFIYRGNRVVFWSAEEKRIPDLEDLEDKTELRDVALVKFPIIKYLGDEAKAIEAEFKDKGDVYLLGFVQEPWKYVGVQALAVNTEIDYCICKFHPNEDFYIVAFKRVPEIARRFECKNPEIISIAKGNALLNIVAKDTIFNRELCIVPDDKISIYFGSGINIISPAHDVKFEKIARDYNLSLESFIDDNNYFVKSLGFYFANTHYTDGNNKVIKKLKNSNALFATWKFENNYKVVKGSGERLVVRSLPAFFLRVNKNLKLNIIKEMTLTKFIPDLNFGPKKEKNLKYQPKKKKKVETEDAGKEYFNLIEELDDFEDWCISEVNSWGVPIPYFINTKTNLVLMNSTIIDHLANLFKKEGSDVWFTWNIEKLLPEEYKAEADNLIKGKENFESWFDSAISWYAILNIADFKSEDFIIKSLDISPTEENTRIETVKQNRIKDHLKDLTDNFKAISNKEIDEEEDSEEKKSLAAMLPRSVILEHFKAKVESVSKNNATENALFPADIVVEGYDQHNNWFLLSSITSLALNKASFFRIAKTHGFITDSTGVKLSKSTKNFIDTLDIIDGSIKRDFKRHYGMGADTVRLYLLKHDEDSSFKLYEDHMEKAKNEIKIIRKMSKVALSLLDGFKLDKDTLNAVAANLSKNKGIFEYILINEFMKVYVEVTEKYSKYEFAKALDDLLVFIDEVFLDFYIDSVKPEIIFDDKSSVERLTSQYVLAEVFRNIMALLTPVIPFTAQEVYSHMSFIPSEDKLPYANFEKIHENIEILIKNLDFKINYDLNFNSENLVKIKQEINEKIEYYLNKCFEKTGMDKNKPDLDLTFFINEETYEYLLLDSLGDKINTFFGVANVYIDTEKDKEKTNQDEECNLKKFSLFYKKANSDREKIKVSIQFGISISNKHKCLRCNYNKCSKENKICESCSRHLKYI